MTIPDQHPPTQASAGKRVRLIAVASVAYAVAALLLDTLATQNAVFIIEWGRFAWNHSSGADLLKFTIWFLIPFCFALRGLDLRYFTFARWRKIDWVLLAAVTGIGAACMLILPYLPGVGEYYQGWGNLPIDARTDQAIRTLVWTASWLTGWEFLFRYLLPRTLARVECCGPKIALILIPFLEGSYHVIQQKPALESLGMVALSVILTAWTLRRRNSLLPFLGHVLIEIELIIYLFFAG
jgi:hypothetical protein